MGYENRKELYEKLQDIRCRPVIAYVTSIRPGMSGQMAQDCIPYIIEQIESISQEYFAVDFLIISNGGDPIAAQRIVSILRERFDSISVLVPYVAFSAATVLALGADEIIMHPYSNLGPVDPQLTVAHPNRQSSIAFSSEDIRNYIEFVKNDLGMTDQSSLAKALESLTSEVGALSMGSSKRSQQLTLSLSEKMLMTHMDDKGRAATIAQILNSNFFHHGYAVSRAEAKEIGLQVTEPNTDVETILWDIWKDFDAEMNCSQPFDPNSEALRNIKKMPALECVPVVQMPVGIPQECNAAIANAIASQIIIDNRETTQYECLIACIESPRARRHIANKFFSICWRDSSLNFNNNTTVIPGAWE